MSDTLQEFSQYHVDSTSLLILRTTHCLMLALMSSAVLLATVLSPFLSDLDIAWTHGEAGIVL